MEVFLQWVGGVFYLLNKVFLSASERADCQGRKRQWRILSWAVYLVGLPAWVVLLAGRHDWIASALEASGAPAMLLGLITALRGTTRDSPQWLDRIALFAIPLGLGYSVYDFGGINTLGQWLEIGLVVGFLVGTYQLAREQSSGYLWYVLMHVCAGSLMLHQNFRWLFWQQVLSLVFITEAYRASRGKESKKDKEGHMLIYKPFTLSNLAEVREVVLEKKAGTLWMTTVVGGGSSTDMVNMGDGHEDDKVGHFDIASCRFVVRLMEQITGFKFAYRRNSDEEVSWARTDEPVRR